jgi:hypothetical protein
VATIPGGVFGLAAFEVVERLGMIVEVFFGPGRLELALAGPRAHVPLLREDSISDENDRLPEPPQVPLGALPECRAMALPQSRANTDGVIHDRSFCTGSRFEDGFFRMSIPVVRHRREFCLVQRSIALRDFAGDSVGFASILASESALRFKIGIDPQSPLVPRSCFPPMADSFGKRDMRIQSQDRLGLAELSVRVSYYIQ